MEITLKFLIHNLFAMRDEQNSQHLKKEGPEKMDIHVTLKFTNGLEPCCNNEFHSLCD